MVYSDILGAVIERFADRSDSAFTSKCYDIIAEAPDYLEQHRPLPWFLAKAITQATVAGSQYPDWGAETLPTGYIQDVDEGRMFVKNTTSQSWEPVVKKDFDTLQRKYPSYSSSDYGIPKHYAWLGKSCYLFPTPDQVYTLLYWYYKEDTRLTYASDWPNGENDWMKYSPDTVIGHCVRRLGRWLRDERALAEGKETLEQGWRALDIANVEHQIAGMPLSMGG